MTPVEERIDHAEAKRIAERFVANSQRPTPRFFPDPGVSAALARAYLDLLTEHSAREEVVRAARAFAHKLLLNSGGEEWSVAPASVQWIALCSALELLPLPATEPAQPEEEPNG